MKQFDQDIKTTLTNRLDHNTYNSTFEDLWKLHSGEKRRQPRFKKTALVPMLVIISMLAFCTIGFAAIALSRQADNVDLPFVEDPAVIGSWEAVDLVNEMDDFNPGESSYNGSLYLNQLAFIKDGAMLSVLDHTNLAPTSSTWTKGYVLDTHDKTASTYEIKTIDGTNYMFMQWKSGDYVFRFLQPKYCVLKQIDNKDYSAYMPIITEDKIDYPFVDNPEMLGKWESVDLVSNIESFDPDKKQYEETLGLKELDIKENGKLVYWNMENKALRKHLRWTDNLIIDSDNKTASKCTFKTIDKETYMFFEWKSGDYSYRGMEPKYYVLKKTQ